MNHVSNSRRLFLLINYTLLTIVALLCFLPIVHILAVSLSSKGAATAGLVKLWPVDFTWSSYEYVLNKPQFLISMWVTVQRVILGTGISMLLTLLVAYPLSKEPHQMKFRTAYAWIFVFTTLFSGGLIPWYMTVRDTGLIDTLWALVIPGALPVFNVILLLNFFRGLPKEVEESCFMDGGGYWTSLWRIYAPLSLPAMATVTLFTIVGHWNSWFDGLILMNSPEKYPLSSYLQTVIVQENLSNMTADQAAAMADVSNRTFKAAQIFIGSLPILLVYPFLQRYFVKGIVLGSVKG
ncbi:carbohydrate ABC transporter permease [Paenibacillus lemnae]|uniref:Carbohydrate ABC transporter permease n=1 Tax=Paenibacillus lemnae TaxID=1330551 RepID=A0A848MCB9_PAELE|nr:carbohydrate ABC transporter permease [Paenibacillus lemnae]NMO97703.1 carbohydrate ABC transporter permease [Paenibacillus lemnae]